MRFSIILASAVIIVAAALAPIPATSQVPPPPPQHVDPNARLILPPLPSPQTGPVVPPPAPVRKFRTGAKSSRHHWLAYQATRHPHFVHMASVVPPQFTPAVILTTAQMSYWGNDQYGDCVSAEEAFAKDIYPVYYSTAGKPVDLTTATVTGFARQHGWLNGADLTSVMDAMISQGMTQDGVTYTDGPYQSVDYTNWQVLTSAIYQGPVKIGVAAGQLQNTPGVGSTNGWVATGYRRDGNVDHCTSLCGYGTMQVLATAMGVTLPAGVNGSTNAVLFFTWDTIGIMDYPSLLNITSEAWLRSPTTPQTPPTPTPTPSPTPAPYVYTLDASAPPGSSIDSQGIFHWSAPLSQAPGIMTVKFTVAVPGVSTAGSFQLNVTAASPTTITVAPIPDQSVIPGGAPLTVDLSRYVTAH